MTFSDRLLQSYRTISAGVQLDSSYQGFIQDIFAGGGRDFLGRGGLGTLPARKFYWVL